MMSNLAAPQVQPSTSNKWHEKNGFSGTRLLSCFFYCIAFWKSCISLWSGIFTAAHIFICFICLSLYKYEYLFISPYSNCWTLTKCHFPLGAPRIETRGDGGNRPMPCVDLGATKIHGEKRGMSRDDSSWNSSLIDFLVNKNQKVELLVFVHFCSSFLPCIQARESCRESHGMIDHKRSTIDGSDVPVLGIRRREYLDSWAKVINHHPSKL